MRIIYLTAILFFTFSSCAKWLDVTPNDIIIEDEMFKIGEGYRNALNGVYREMSTGSMYGKEMSWGMVDVMGQCYKTGTGIKLGHTYYYVGYDANYEDQNVKALTSGIWTTAYNVIANCNNLIARVKETEPKKFRGGLLEKEMILGEATALRGFIHFDMLRLFGAAPVKGMNEVAIPYFKNFKSLFEPRQTTKEILDLVIADLKEGRDLVINFDTLTVDGVDRRTWMRRSNRFSDLWGDTGSMPDDPFYGFRGYRMNHLAITAALARVYNYYEKHDLALEEANKVISYNIPKYNEAAFIFTSKPNVASDRKLSSGIIFTLAEKDIYEFFEYYKEDNRNLVELLKNGDAKDFDDLADYRYSDLLIPHKDKKSFIPNKYMQPLVQNDNTAMVADMLPMIRLSEMHYISAEAYASKGDFASATASLDKVRIGRSCKMGILNITDMGTFRTELMKEVKREFICEGQAFFYFKKLNILPRTTFTDKVFVLPLPENENVK